MRTTDQRQGAPRIRSNLVVVENDKKGITRDISATGIFFEIDAIHKPGSTIQFHIELNTQGGMLKLICEAEVVRVEDRQGKFGIAAKILKQEIKGT